MWHPNQVRILMLIMRVGGLKRGRGKEGGRYREGLGRAIGEGKRGGGRKVGGN